jgi:hypothetical protein
MEGETRVSIQSMEGGKPVSSTPNVGQATAGVLAEYDSQTPMTQVLTLCYSDRVDGFYRSSLSDVITGRNTVGETGFPKSLLLLRGARPFRSPKW